MKTAIGMWMLVVPWLACLGFGCKDSGSASADPAALYAVETSPVSVQAGGTASAQIRFAPRQGYHWNEEFPARVRVADNPALTLAKTEFKSGGTDFQVADGAGVLPIPVTGKTAGKTALKATADFSMCNKDECRIFKGIAVEVPVDVQ